MTAHASALQVMHGLCLEMREFFTCSPRIETLVRRRKPRMSGSLLYSSKRKKPRNDVFSAVFGSLSVRRYGFCGFAFPIAR